MKFHALGKKVSTFKKLETFDAPKHTAQVRCTSDEVTANCPVTGQPDWYVVDIMYMPKRLCVESKSLKLYLQSFRNAGLFCEAFAERIAQDVQKATRAKRVFVEVSQKPRGGIAIKSSSVIQEEKP